MKKIYLFFCILLMWHTGFSQTKNVKTFYDLAKTKIHEEWTALNAPPYQKHGFYREWDVRGTLIREMNYKNGAQDGVTKVYNPMFDPQDKDCYGKLINFSNFKNGKRHGSQKTFGCSEGVSKPMHESEFVDGIVIKETVYYHNGKKKSAIVKDGECQEWYENGQVKSKYTLKDGVEHGVKTLWHENGQIQMKNSLINGKENGEGTAYYASGKLMARFIADSSIPFYKELERFYEDGKPKSKLEIANGLYITTYFDSISGNIEKKTSEKFTTDSNEPISHGEFTTYYSSGALKSKYYMDSNKRQGAAVFNDEKGNQISGGQFTNGMPVGEWKYIVNKQNEITEDYSDAAYIFHMSYNANGYQGDTSAKYTLTGEKISRGTYHISDKGLIYDDGAIKEFYINGIVRQEGSSYKGKKNGEWRYYDKDGQLQKVESYSYGDLRKTITSEEILVQKIADMKKQLISNYTDMNSQNSNPVVIKYYYSDNKSRLAIFEKAILVSDYYLKQTNDCKDLSCLQLLGNKLENIFKVIDMIPEDEINKTARKLSSAKTVEKIQTILPI